MFLSPKLQRTVFSLGGALAALLAVPVVGQAQSTVFTYQGQLKDGGMPAGGAHDMVFRVFDADVGGAQHGADFPLPGVAVQDGLFTVNLDFGAGIFTASPRWLEIEVNGQALVPRQEITATPFAQTCNDAANAVYAATAGLAGPWQTDGVNVSYVDGNVGIGTAAPAQKLSVAGTIESTTDGFKFPDGTVQASASTGGPGFWSSNGTHIFKNNSGNVGIGRTSPTFMLDTNSSTGFGARFGMQAAGGGALVVASNPGDNRVYLQGYNSTDNGSATEMLITGYAGGVLPLLTVSATKTTASGLLQARGAWDGEQGALELFATDPTLRFTMPNSGGFQSSWVMQLDGGFGGSGNLNMYNKLGAGGWNHTLAYTIDGYVGIGTTAPASKLDIAATGDGAELLRFTTERPWVFRQFGSGSGAMLELKATVGLKDFRITAAGGTNVATFWGNDADPRLTVNGTTVTKVLQITGADLAEKFATSECAEPGMVMEIDPENPGQLRMARGAYNQRVAGVVSGANDFPAGAILGNLPEHEDAPPIALSGRVWTYCDAGDEAIAPGDLLTTSATAGHAMKSIDRAQSHGAVLGKAMTALARGERGLVLVLVNLQ